MVREDPVIVPAAVTVKAQAVGLRASGCWTVVESDGTRPRNSKWLDLSALDQYRLVTSAVWCSVGHVCHCFERKSSS